MAHWVNITQWQTDSGGSRSQGKSQTGTYGNHVDPNFYRGYGCPKGPPVTTLPNGSKQPGYDVPNLSFVSVVLSSVNGSSFPYARNKAYAKFVSRVGEGGAQLGVDIIQWRLAFDMIHDRTLGAYHAYRDLRNGNFRKFLKDLGLTPKRKDRNKIKEWVGHASDTWLEYSYGWKPLFQDIYGAMDVLSKPLTVGRVTGSGRETYSRPNTPVPNGAWEFFSTTAKVKCGGFVSVSDPNAYLLNRLGIANPASIAWELIPFSFVVDWVFDVSTFLGSFTDLLGLSVSRTFTTTYAKADVSRSWWYNFAPVTTKTRKADVYVVRRDTGLPTPLPNISIRANIGHSLTRAANAVSLLGQILTK